MSEDQGGRSTLPGSPFEIIVKGGTTSAAYDREVAERRHAAEVGREHQEKQMRAAAEGDLLTTEGFTSSRLHSLRMMDSGSPRLILYYMNRDKTVRQECLAEIVIVGDGDELFTLACPKCVERGIPMGDAQCRVLKSHRYFEIRYTNDLVRMIDPFDGKEFWVRRLGFVSCQDIIRCSNFNCTWAVRIDESRVWEV